MKLIYNKDILKLTDLQEKVKDSNFVHFLEVEAKVKIPYKISPPLCIVDLRNRVPGGILGSKRKIRFSQYTEESLPCNHIHLKEKKENIYV